MPEAPLPSPLAAASVSSRGHFDVVVGLQRVGTPKLRPLPLETLTNGSVLMGLLRKQSLPMKCAIRDILIRNGLPEASCEEDPDGFEFDISDRYKPHDLERTREPTIYVTAPWTEESAKTWYEAAKELKIWADSFLDFHDMEHVDINIEIISKKLIQKKYTTAAPRREDWSQGWKTVQARIHDILQSHESTKSNWDCVALVNFGPNIPPNPNPTTVYISLDHACDEGLIAGVIQPAIQTYLDQTPFGWRLHIEHSLPDSF